MLSGSVVHREYIVKVKSKSSPKEERKRKFVQPLRETVMINYIISTLWIDSDTWSLETGPNPSDLPYRYLGQYSQSCLELVASAVIVDWERKKIATKVNYCGHDTRKLTFAEKWLDHDYLSKNRLTEEPEIYPDVRYVAEFDDVDQKDGPGHSSNYSVEHGVVNKPA